MHRTLDAWWAERGFRGDANDLPILMVAGFFDVESRGAFQGYQELRDDGSHMIVVERPRRGARRHGCRLRRVEGMVRPQPARDRQRDRGRAAGEALARRRRPRGLRRGPARPRRRRRLADPRHPLAVARAGPSEERHRELGERRDALARRSAAGARGAVLPEPAVACRPTRTFPNIGLVGAMGLDQLSTAFPMFTDMTVSEPPGSPTRPRRFAATSSPPARRASSCKLSTTAPETGIWAVVSDVSPDGTAHPVATGRLSTDYPEGPAQALADSRAARSSSPTAATTAREPARRRAQERLYRVELWPIGNRFKAGHRIRLSHRRRFGRLAAERARREHRDGRGSGRVAVPLPGPARIRPEKSARRQALNRLREPMASLRFRRGTGFRRALASRGSVVPIPH